MGDKSPKSKRRKDNQKGVAKKEKAAKARAKQDRQGVDASPTKR